MITVHKIDIWPRKFEYIVRNVVHNHIFENSVFQLSISTGPTLHNMDSLQKVCKNVAISKHTSGKRRLSCRSPVRYGVKNIPFCLIDC